MDDFLSPLSEERRRALSDRQHGKPSGEPHAKSYRTPAQRDRDRILYTGALQRLASVTQVTASESGYTFHNRLSHSLKVAQVGRRNAERLQSLVEKKEINGEAARLVTALDPDAVEASCLGHDLGHPPFGHTAEKALHDRSTQHVRDGFNGNAQSFRIVTRLAVRSREQGLNLTRRTLDGLLKYPWAYRPSDPPDDRARHWGYYDEDSEAFAFAREFRSDKESDPPERCLEAALMDWADDLTYAVHDVDDFFRAGLIPLDRLQNETSSEVRRLRRMLEDAEQSDPGALRGYDPEELVEVARLRFSVGGPSEPYDHTQAARAAMRTLGSRLITDYLDAFTVTNDPGSGKVKLQIDPNIVREVEALKLLVTVYVVRRPGLSVVQHGQQRLIRSLYDYYFKASAAGTDGDRRLFPPGVKERLENTDNSPEARARIVVDLIAGLTEDSAMQLHQRLTGGRPGPVLDATAYIG